MGQTIDALRRLQAVELKLAAIRKEREARTRRVESQQKLLKKVEDKEDEQKRLHRERKLKIDAVQLDIAVREESVAKHRTALNKAKTNKEYATILAAMNTEKADTTKIETEVLKEMEELQTADNKLQEIDAERAKVLQSLQVAQKALGDYDASVKSEWDRMMAERQSFATAIPAAALSAFTRTAERNDGEAMAAVIKLHPKRDEWACSGCNMKVTLDLVNALQTRDEIQNCKICGRVLYFDFGMVKTKS